MTADVLDIYRVLDRLPDTTDGLAAMLHTAGIRGRMENPSDCPMARLLALFTDEEVLVDTMGSVQIGPRHLDVPLQVDDFVLEFDRGDFPELVDRPMLCVRGVS